MRLLFAAALLLPTIGTQAGAVLTTLYSFTGGTDGGSPSAGLVQGSDGCFYGTTYEGGEYTNQYGVGYGTVFKISTAGVLTNLYAFTGINDGASPAAGLAQGGDGNFYGTTSDDSLDYGSGTVFKISPDGALSTLHSFTGGNDGSDPVAALVQGSAPISTARLTEAVHMSLAPCSKSAPTAR